MHRTERFDSSLHRKWWYRRLSMRPPLRLRPLRLCLRRPCFAHHCHRRTNHHRRHRQAHTGECTKSSGARRRRCSICRVRRRSALAAGGRWLASGGLRFICCADLPADAACISLRNKRPGLSGRPPCYSKRKDRIVEEDLRSLLKAKILKQNAIPAAGGPHSVVEQRAALLIQLTSGSLCLRQLSHS